MMDRLAVLACSNDRLQVAGVGDGLINAVEDHMFWLILGSVAIVGIVFGSFTAIVKTRARERSRREIAAYIAEGSMTAEQGERLLAAGEEAEE